MSSKQLNSYRFLSERDKIEFAPIQVKLDEIFAQLIFTTYRGINFFTLPDKIPRTWKENFRFLSLDKKFIDRMFENELEECEMYFRLGKYEITAFVDNPLIIVNSTPLALYVRDYLIELMSGKIKSLNLENNYVCSTVQNIFECNPSYIILLFYYNIGKVDGYFQCNVLTNEIANLEFNLTANEGRRDYSKSIII